MFKILSICKGGGYFYCKTEPSHPKINSKGLYPLHRVLVENNIERILKKNEVIHHKNENKNDNRIENLELLTRSTHSKLHKKEIKSQKVVCGECKKVFYLKPYAYRLRIRRNKSKKIFCSIKCGSIYQWKKFKIEIIK